MKLSIILLLFSATFLRAQVPHIDYMMADEAKSQLQIHGTFGPDNTGFATIENTKQSVRFWSDTMVICDLPDSGAGSGGHVTVTQISGMSNVRMLSIFKMKMDTLFWTRNIGPPHNYVFAGGLKWIVNWRMDIGMRLFPVSIIPFEISKSSYGTYIPGLAFGGGLFPAVDSLTKIDSSVSLSGIVDLENYIIKFNTSTLMYKVFYYLPTIYYPYSINFDTIGTISSYQHFYTAFGDPQDSLSDRLYDSKILFPPSPKNAVTQSPEPLHYFVNILSNIGSEGHKISFEAEAPLGETTASLYSIDGRLLKQEKISISSAGMYSFDASGINGGFGYLVVKTPQGIVAGKVMF